MPRYSNVGKHALSKLAWMLPTLRTLWEGLCASVDEASASKTPQFLDEDYPDLTGAVWVVTGANGGIGTEVAKKLARKGAKVWLIARSHAKLEETVQLIKTEQPEAQLDTCVMDFSDLTTIKPGVQKILSNHTELHGIIHNAGVMFAEKGLKTAQGFEYQVGVNNVGPQLLQHFLDPLLERAMNRDPRSDLRIVWISSLALYLTSYEFDKPNDTTRSVTERYAFSKAINYVQSVQWPLHHPGTQVLSVAAHPGIIKTELFRHTDSFSDRLIDGLKWPPEYGAYTELFAALSPEICKEGSAFVVPFGRIGRVSTELYKRAHSSQGQKLWDWIDEQIEPYK